MRTSLIISTSSLSNPPEDGCSGSTPRVGILARTRYELFRLSRPCRLVSTLGLPFNSAGVRLLQEQVNSSQSGSLPLEVGLRMVDTNSDAENYFFGNWSG